MCSSDLNYYYIASDLKAVKNGTYYVTKTNGLKDAGFYSFDADGKMIIKSGLSRKMATCTTMWMAQKQRPA